MKERGNLNISNPTSNVTYSISGEPVSQGETWVFNETLRLLSGETFIFNFVSNNESFTQIYTGSDYLEYGDGFYPYDGDNWEEPDYKTIILATAPTGDLLTWLQANAVKQ